MTHKESTAELYKEGTVTPPEGIPSQIRHHSPLSSPRLQSQLQKFSSPPSDTQPLSQFVYPPQDDEVEDEEAEGIWGYLYPLDSRYGEKLVLRHRGACPAPQDLLEINSSNARLKKPKRNPRKAEEDYETNKRMAGLPAGGYLIGRHIECGTERETRRLFDVNLLTTIIRSYTRYSYSIESALPTVQ